jgi:hypothetical protein
MVIPYPRGGLFLGSLMGVRERKQDTSASFAILCELGKRLCQFPTGETLDQPGT